MNPWGLAINVSESNYICRQDISSHDIDDVELVCSCLTRGRISTTCVMYVNVEEWQEW